MDGKRRLGFIVVSILLASCAQADDSAEELPADTMAMMPATAGDPNGTWEMRSVPVSTTDTVPTIYQLQVSNGTWTLQFANRDPIVGRVVADADSFIMEAGPYQSVRREGVTVTTHSVYRINGDQITGTATARYQGAGADSVLQLTTTGTRVR